MLEVEMKFLLTLPRWRSASGSAVPRVQQLRVRLLFQCSDRDFAANEALRLRRIGANNR